MNMFQKIDTGGAIGNMFGDDQEGVPNASSANATTAQRKIATTNANTLALAGSETDAGKIAHVDSDDCQCPSCLESGDSVTGREMGRQSGGASSQRVPAGDAVPGANAIRGNQVTNRIIKIKRDFIFTGEISKVDHPKQLLFGWAYISHDKDGTQVIDKSGEFVPDPGTLEDAVYKYVLDCRKGRDFHGLLSKNDGSLWLPDSTLVESMYFSKEKQEALGIPPGILPVSGWWVGFKTGDRALWDRVQRGERCMFSIHGSGMARVLEE